MDIVIPARNAAATLGATVASIKRQTHRDFRCWIVDDASYDETWLVAEALSEKDDRFQVVRTSTNAGPAIARNIGATQGTAPLLAFCDADDTWDADKLERQVALAERGAAVVLSGTAVHYPNYGKVLAGRLFTKEMFRPDCVLARLLSFNMAVCGSNLLVRRDAFDTCGGFSADLAPSDDYDILLKLAYQGYRFSYDPRETVHYVRNHQSITSRKQVEVMSALARCVKKWEELGCRQDPELDAWKTKVNDRLFKTPSEYENVGETPYFIANPYMLDDRGRARGDHRRPRSHPR